jgi:hypothetical protein
MREPRLALVNPGDFDIPRCVDNADEAIALVRELHGTWQTSHKPAFWTKDQGRLEAHRHPARELDLL